MVYECEHCGTALPPDVSSCPMCHQSFDEAVPADAEVRKRGWQTQADKTHIPPRETPVPPGEKRVLPNDALRSSVLSSAEPAAVDPSSQDPGNPDWKGHAQNLKDLGHDIKDLGHDILQSPAGQKLHALPLLSGLKSFLKTRKMKIALSAAVGVVVLICGMSLLLRAAHPLIGSWADSLDMGSLTLTYSPLGTYHEVLIQSNELNEEMTGSYSDDGAHVIMHPQTVVSHSPDGTATTETGPQQAISFSYVIHGNTMTIINSEGAVIIYVRQ